MAVNYEALNKMSDEQLRELNSGIIAVLRQRQTFRMQSVLTGFKVGDKVEFHSNKFGGTTVTARITKLNQKTCSCVELLKSGADSNRTWRVAATLLHRVYGD